MSFLKERAWASAGNVDDIDLGRFADDGGPVVDYQDEPENSKKINSEQQAA